MLELAGFEADDIIATLATEAARPRRRRRSSSPATATPTSWSRTPTCRVLYNRRGVSDYVLYDEAGIEERTGVTPALYPQYAALRGDPSDNLPGRSRRGGEDGGQAHQHLRRPRRHLRPPRRAVAEAAPEPGRRRADGRARTPSATPLVRDRAGRGRPRRRWSWAGGTWRRSAGCSTSSSSARSGTACIEALGDGEAERGAERPAAGAPLDVDGGAHRRATTAVDGSSWLQAGWSRPGGTARLARGRRRGRAESRCGHRCDGLAFVDRCPAAGPTGPSDVVWFGGELLGDRRGASRPGRPGRAATGWP